LPVGVDHQLQQRRWRRHADFTASEQSGRSHLGDVGANERSAHQHRTQFQPGCDLVVRCPTVDLQHRSHDAERLGGDIALQIGRSSPAQVGKRCGDVLDETLPWSQDR
jgi:hypothetical protein